MALGATEAEQVLNKFLCKLKGFWHDPVWSKVIAGVILGGGALFLASFFNPIGSPPKSAALSCEPSMDLFRLTEAWTYTPSERAGDGLAKISGNIAKTVGTQWPYRCRLVHYGTTPLSNVEVLFTVTFKEVLRSGPSRSESGKITTKRVDKLRIAYVDPGVGNGFQFWIYNMEPDRFVAIDATADPSGLVRSDIHMSFGPHTMLPERPPDK